MTRRWDEPGSCLAYRIAWELAGRTVPDGQYLHHRCHQPLCCNPAHLEAVTQSYNLIQRRYNPNPHCKPPPKPKQPPVPKVQRVCPCGKIFDVVPSRARPDLGIFCSRRCVRRNPEERFWLKVRKTDGCWHWTGARGQYGHGLFPKGPKNAGCVQAHRFSYELHVGPIPNCMQVLHRCDTPGCVNPACLFLGTQLDNMRDMHSKGRFRHWDASGEKNPRATITSNDVRLIRRRHAEGVSSRRIAGEIGCSYSVVKDVVAERTWKHI